MDDLIAWLRAQLDEDERDAPDVHERGCAVDQYRGFREECGCDRPKRVLGEVKAKRDILNCFVGPTGEVLGYFSYGRANVTPQYLIKLLAQPYAGRDGWREEWRA